ncbi:MAG: helix-turn-helix domain-containing protein [Candidatus Jordarchaeaceae archaeon]
MKIIAKKGSEEVLLALQKGPRKFKELEEALAPKINRRTIARRLIELETAGLILRKISAYRPPSTTYELTEKGKETLKLIIKLEK